MIHDKLRVCPLCGSAMEIIQEPIFRSDTPTEYLTIRCSKDINECLLANGVDALYRIDERKELIDAWNNRAKPKENVRFIEVSECLKCPYISPSRILGALGQCDKYQRSIFDLSVFPDYCKLLRG